MKNIFKFMGIALMASAMIMTSCKKDEDKTNTPDNPQPGQASCTITWGGAAANTGVIDGYMYSSTSTVYILIASAGLENDNYTFPIYRFGLDLDTDPQYGCALTAKYAYGQQQINGNKYWPTDVIEEVYYQSEYDKTLGGIIGDWWLDVYTTQQDLSMTNAQFDATTRTLSASITVSMLSYADVDGYIAGIDQPTDADYNTALAQAEKKNLGLTMNNYVFDAAAQK